MAHLSPAALNTLAALLARLKSPYDGERLAAATLVTNFIENHNTTWSEVLNPPAPPPVVQQPAPPPPTGPRYWRNTAEDCLFDHSEALNEWEQGFLQDILRRGYALSVKQDASLRRIAKKTGIPEW